MTVSNNSNVPVMAAISRAMAIWREREYSNGDDINFTAVTLNTVFIIHIDQPNEERGGQTIGLFHVFIQMGKSFYVNWTSEQNPRPGGNIIRQMSLQCWR